jgi:hypothetical protein
MGKGIKSKSFQKLLAPRGPWHFGNPHIHSNPMDIKASEGGDITSTYPNVTSCLTPLIEDLFRGVLLDTIVFFTLFNQLLVCSFMDLESLLSNLSQGPKT